MGCGASTPVSDDATDFSSDSLSDESFSSECDEHLEELERLRRQKERRQELNVGLGGSPRFDPNMDYNRDQVLFWVQHGRDLNLSDFDYRTFICRLAAFRDPKDYEHVRRYANVLFDLDDLQFWKDHTEKQKLECGQVILNRYNYVFHGARNVHHAKNLKDLDHLEWWHSQYPDEGFDQIILRVKNGATDAMDAARRGWSLTQDQLLYWKKETGDSIFEIWRIRQEAGESRLFKLDCAQLIQVFNLSHQTIFQHVVAPLEVLDILCRKSGSLSMQHEIENMMEDFGPEELWTKAVKFFFGHPKSVRKTWYPKFLEALARVHPVHHNDFWPIRHLVMNMGTDHSETRIGQLELVLSNCTQNPRTPFITQVALSKHHSVVDALNEWSAPPAYTE